MDEVPTPSSSAASARLSRHPRRDTSPEMALRRALHAAGCRYRVQWRTDIIPRRSIDIAFPGRRVAVFVDGCYWHGCPIHGSTPKSNSRWWSEKFARNRRRDADTDGQLRAAGWLVLRVWEHVQVEAAVADVLRVLAEREHGPAAPVRHSSGDRADSVDDNGS